MSEKEPENRIILTVPIEVIIILILLVLPIWVIYSNIHSAERENASRQQQKTSFIECLDPTLGNVLECVPELANAPDEQDAEYYDLKAQQDMAKWALLMFVVTGVGVAYVALTFQASRDTLDEAKRVTDETRKTGLVQSRAYIGIDTLKLKNFQVGLVPEIVCKVKNFGQTPASEFCDAYGLYWGPRESGQMFPKKGMDIKGPIMPTHVHTICVSFGETLTESGVADLRESGDVLHFIFYATYRDFTGRKRRFLSHTFAPIDDLREEATNNLGMYQKHNRAT